MSSLFDAAAEITRPLGVKKPDPIKQHEHDLECMGWVLHCGYELVEWDEDRPVIQIVQLELNTGQHVYPLALRDIPGGELTMIEELIGDEEYADAYEAAKALARDPRDDGDYAFDRANEKRHESQR